MENQKIEKFARLISERVPAVFFGGAGVSTESGVKDYRSEDGLYTTVNQYGVPPEVILSHSFFFEHTDVFYDFFYKYFLTSEPMPNPAHKALSQLEHMGILSAVITQNIDGLHQAAGSKNVFELHGTVYRYHCLGCGKEFDRAFVADKRGSIPTCPTCGGLIKPDVVLYEEALDGRTVTEAIRAISNSKLMIIGGTSLAVYPAAGLLRYFSGDDIVLINRDETPYDSRATLIFRDRIGEVMSEVMKLIPSDRR